MYPASLEQIREDAEDCTRCPLYARATQTVFGEGALGSLMLVGEQPGDVEDREGKPLVGPAGRLLRAVLEEVGIAKNDVYVTNAVKHFKWKPRGKRRMHEKPSWAEVRACSHWLLLELESGTPALVTLHPSAVLRADDQRDVRRAELVADLELARRTLSHRATRREDEPDEPDEQKRSRLSRSGPLCGSDICDGSLAPGER